MNLKQMDTNGKAQMEDVSSKPKVKRTATAYAKIFLQAQTLELIQDNYLQKGDALAVAKIAGISAAKHASDLIPLCHNIVLDHINLYFEIKTDGIEIFSKAVCIDKTGVEMQALTAVSIAALTIYDMCKAVDKKMHIGSIKLIEKTKDHILT